MREIKVRIRFTKECLGNVKTKTAGSGNWPVFVFPRGANKHVRFDPAWWRSGLRFAADLLCRHQDSVGGVLADPEIQADQSVSSMCRRWLDKKRYVMHECFPEGMTISVCFAVPESISNDAMHQLLDKMGTFRGISPFGPRDYGLFVVENVEPCGIDQHVEPSENEEGRAMSADIPVEPAAEETPHPPSDIHEEELSSNVRPA